MSVPSSTVTLLTMMIFHLWLTVQLTSHPSLAYNLYPMPDNWDPLIELHYTENHNIASLLTGDSLATDASKCVSYLNTHLNANQVCKRQLYDWLKIDMDNTSPDAIKEENGNFTRKYVQFTLTCYFRLACVHCAALELNAYRTVVTEWFTHYGKHEDWQPLVIECFDPPVTELAQCDAALEQAKVTENCTAQVQLKLDQSKEDVRPHDRKCTAEYEDRMCMVAQVCAHCQSEHVPKYFEYWNKAWDPVYEECWRNKEYFEHPKRVCTVTWNYVPVFIIVGVVAAFLILIIFCHFARPKSSSSKRTRTYGSSVGGGSSSSLSRGSSSYSRG